MITNQYDLSFLRQTLANIPLWCCHQEINHVRLESCAFGIKIQLQTCSKPSVLIAPQNNPLYLDGISPEAAIRLPPLCSLLHHKESDKFVPSKAAKTDRMKRYFLLKYFSREQKHKPIQQKCNGGISGIKKLRGFSFG